MDGTYGDYDVNTLPSNTYADDYSTGAHLDHADSDKDANEITQEDAWEVISAYFDEKGLVRQQLDSYDQFVWHTMQKMVKDTPEQTVRKESHFEYYVKFGQLSFHTPSVTDEHDRTRQITPQEARLRNLTYSAAVSIDVEVERVTPSDEGTVNREILEVETVALGDVPVMLHSKICKLSECASLEDRINLGECPFDQGGYFVVNGSEKVIIAQEEMAHNNVFIWSAKSEPGEGPKFVCECRSKPVDTRTAQATYVRRSKSNQFEVEIPYVNANIPLMVVFRALGLSNDREILSHIVYRFDSSTVGMLELLKPSLIAAETIQEPEHALAFIGTRGNRSEGLVKSSRVAWAVQALQKEMLPHVTMDPAETGKKIFYLGYMTHRLLSTYSGTTEADDRDHYGNKRLNLVGPLLGTLFRNLFQKFVKDARNQMQADVDKHKGGEGHHLDIKRAINTKTITDQMKYCISTGNWGSGKTAGAKSGVSQVLSRLNYAAMLSHMRRLNTPGGSSGKVPKLRQLHSTQWGMLCPAETPEGHQCGLVKNLSMMAHVTVGSDSMHVQEALHRFGTENLNEISPEDADQYVKVFVNGDWIGVNRDSDHDLHHQVREERRRQNFSAEVSIVNRDMEKELHIFTDTGRTTRPLFVVKPDEDGEIRLAVKKDHIRPEPAGMVGYENEMSMRAAPEKMKWGDYLAEGLVEYVDVLEEETILVAMTPNLVKEARDALRKGDNESRYTHCEIHPAMILGVCASIIPFPDHNQSPRNTYQSAMGKQAMGIYATNFSSRMDITANILFYPQKPLVGTRAMKYLNFSDLPAGINAVIAIACYSGFNQEDSLIMSQSAIDRGLFRSMGTRTYDAAEEKLSTAVETFEKPSEAECESRKHGSYEKLDDDGLVVPGTRVMGADIIVGRTVPLDEASAIEGITRSDSKTKRDTSLAMRTHENGYVDRVMLTTNKEGGRFTKVRIRSMKTPQVGDKFSSRHGQKGTVGITYRQEDMPFTCHGVIPDIIVNPHAIPSRMTVGQLVECLLGKYGCLSGELGDATPFTDVTVKDISDRLHEKGFQRNGAEIMYHGHTGKRLEAQIFIGPTYYQRLKHMVDDKIQARARGQTQNLNRQPLHGRARDGGLRVGEMERDCFIAHGTSVFLMERFFECSDKYEMHVCSGCGLQCIASVDDDSYTCQQCSQKNMYPDIYKVRLPYTCKLLFQELMAMQISPRMVLSRE